MKRTVAFTEARKSGASSLARGFSLVELMVAVAIGLVILAAVSQVFVASRATYTFSENMARVQEAGRFGMEFLSLDARMAGYSGCLNKGIGANNVLAAKTDYAFNFAPGQYLTGHAYTGGGTANLTDWTPNLPNAYFTNGEVVPYTDVLVIRRASETGIKLSAKMADGNAAISLTGDGKDDTHPSGLFQTNDIAVIGDCTAADVFQITDLTAMTGSSTLLHVGGGNASGLSKGYDVDAEVMKLLTRIYYVGRRPNSDSPSLFRKVLDHGVIDATTTEELVEGVEVMRVAYGEDTNNDTVADQYKGADSVGNWNNVVSARIGMLARSGGNADTVADTNTYDVAGNAITLTAIKVPADNRRRHAFNTTIQVRNP